MFDDDDLWRLKMGRVLEWDARIAENLFRLRSYKDRAPALSTRALSWRQRHVSTGWRYNNGQQVVVKVAGSRKSRSGVFACARYIARQRRCDTTPAPVFDEFWRALSPPQLRAHLAGWQLEADADNRSRRAREYGAEGLGERERLHLVQGWHLIFSIRGEPADWPAFERALAATVDGIFTSRGFRLLTVLHDDQPGRLHAHVLVKAQSEFGGRLRFDRQGDFLDTLRAELAETLTCAGLPCQAGRREDRGDIRRRVMEGAEPLRWPQGRWRGRGDLVRRVPRWLEMFGPEYLARREAALLREKPPKPAAPPWWRRLLARTAAEPEVKVPPAYQPLHKVFCQLYRDPARALASWQWMAVEGASGTGSGNRQLADWHVLRRPEVFGALLPSASHPDPQVLAQVLRQAPPLAVPGESRPISRSPELLRRFGRLRWLARLRRDRLQLVSSLVRLARIVATRYDNEAMGADVMRTARRALDIPAAVSAIPVFLLPTRMAGSGSGGGEGSRAVEPPPQSRPDELGRPEPSARHSPPVERPIVQSRRPSKRRSAER